MRILVRPLLVLILALLVASPAGATPDTLRRSVGNILMAPLDFVLAPYVATKAVVNNVRDIDDTTGVRVAWFLPALVWNTGMQLGGAMLRELAGLIEFVPGLGLVPFEADMDPLYAPAERSEALVDIETTPLWIKFGVNYVD